MDNLNFNWLSLYFPILNNQEISLSLNSFAAMVNDEMAETQNKWNILNLSEYYLFVTGKVLNEDNIEEKAGWVIRILGTTGSNMFNGLWYVTVVANIKENYPSSATLNEIGLTYSLTYFRRLVFPVNDQMSFERTTFLILPYKQKIIRLFRLFPTFYLPTLTMEAHHWDYILSDNTDPSSKPKPTHRKKKKRMSPDNFKKYIRNTLDRLVVTYIKEYGDYQSSLSFISKHINNEIVYMQNEYYNLIRQDNRKLLTDIEVIEQKEGECEFSMEDIAHLLSPQTTTNQMEEEEDHHFF